MGNYLLRPRFTLRSLIAFVVVCAVTLGFVAGWPRYQRKLAVQEFLTAVKHKRGYPERLPNVSSLDYPFYEIDERIRTLRNAGGCDLAVEQLISLLVDKDPAVREIAAHVLGEIACDATNTVPALIDALKHDNEDVVRSAIWALNLAVVIRLESDPGFDEAIPAVIAATKSDHDAVRYLAVQCLGRFHRNSRLVVPALLETLEDRDEGVRSMALDSLTEIAPGLAAEIGVAPLRTHPMNDDDRSGFGGMLVAILALMLCIALGGLGIVGFRSIRARRDAELQRDEAKARAAAAKIAADRQHAIESAKDAQPEPKSPY